MYIFHVIYVHNFIDIRKNDHTQCVGLGNLRTKEDKVQFENKKRGEEKSRENRESNINGRAEKKEKQEEKTGKRKQKKEYVQQS